MRPVQDENGAITVDGVKYRMERFCVEERTFSIQHYLFPIRQSELQKTPTIEQIPDGKPVGMYNFKKKIR